MNPAPNDWEHIKGLKDSMDVEPAMEQKELDL